MDAAITFRGKGRWCRIHFQDAGGTSAAFTYRIDAGAPVTVNNANATFRYRPVMVGVAVAAGDKPLIVTAGGREVDNDYRPFTHFGA